MDKLKMQVNFKKTKYSIALLLCVRDKLKENALLDLDTRSVSYFSMSEFQLLAPKAAPKVKTVQGQQKVPLRSLLTKKVVNVGE